MKKTQNYLSVFILLFLIEASIQGQSTYLRLIEKHNYTKAEKWLTKDIAKMPNDIEINFCMAIMLKDSNYTGYNTELSYTYLLKTKQLYESNQDEKVKKRLERIPLNLGIISNFNDTICLIAFEETVSKGKLESYQRYLDHYINAPLLYKQKAIKRRDEIAYEIAKEANSLESYQYLISNYPNALQILNVINKRNHLVFEDVKKNDNILGYQTFIAEYQDAAEVAQAKERIHELAFDETRKLNASVVYKRFMEQYPQSIQYKQAFELYNKTQFEENVPKRSNWILYAQFIQNYPNNSQKSIAVDSITAYLQKSKDLEAAKYCMENFKHGDRNRALFIYHDLFTNDGEKQTLDLFYAEYDEDALSEIKTQDYQLVELSDALLLDLPYDSLKFSEYDFYIRIAAPHESAFVALQRMISPYIKAKNWKLAAEKVKIYSPYFENNFRKTKDLLTLLENDIDKSIKISSVGLGVNTDTGGEYVPVISADDKLLYFCGKDRKNNIGGEDIFVSKKIKGIWTQAKIVSDLSTTYLNDAPLSISADGTSMFLFKSGEIYYADKTKSGWSEPNRFPQQINGGKWQADAMISSDGKAIFFASTKSGGYNLFSEGGNFHGDNQYASDIYVSTLNENNEWSEPINMGSVINTPYCERSPFLHPDMKTLYFSSDGHGGLGKLDVYKSTRLADSCWNCWSEPINMGKEFNTKASDWCYKISTNGEVAYFSKTNQTGNSEDIYSVNLPKYLRPDLVATVTGKLVDKNNQPITADIRWEDLETGKNVGQSKSDPSDGSFFIVLPVGKIYGYYVDQDKYFPISNHLDLRNNKKPIQINENINMITFRQMIEDGLAVPVNNLFFNFAESVLQPYSIPELKRVAIIIKANKMNVEISGHTDNIGNDQKNYILSEQRALTVRDYLIKEGCSLEALSFKGYGNSRPIVSNDTEDGRSKNRRVEIRFVK